MGLGARRARRARSRRWRSCAGQRSSRNVPGAVQLVCFALLVYPYVRENVSAARRPALFKIAHRGAGARMGGANALRDLKWRRR
jgi:hypothetical protein